MKPIIKFAAITLAGFVLFASCKKDLIVDPQLSNKAPIANAGIDQNIVLPKDSFTKPGLETEFLKSA